MPNWIYFVLDASPRLNFQFPLRIAVCNSLASRIHYYHFDNMSIIKLLFARLVNNFLHLYTSEPPKNDIILQFDNRHLQINMSSSVGKGFVVQSTYIIFVHTTCDRLNIPIDDLCSILI